MHEGFSFHCSTKTLVGQIVSFFTWKKTNKPKKSTISNVLLYRARLNVFEKETKPKQNKKPRFYILLEVREGKETIAENEDWPDASFAEENSRMCVWVTLDNLDRRQTLTLSSKEVIDSHR